MALFVRITEPEAFECLEASVQERAWRTLERYTTGLLSRGGGHPHVPQTAFYTSFLPAQRSRVAAVGAMKRE